MKKRIALLLAAVLAVGSLATACGGNNAGIQTCWYNPNGQKVSGGYQINYEIADLHEIYGILKG